MEITQQLEQEDVIAPNTVCQDIDTDEFSAVANDLAASENNDEDNQKLYEQDEAMGKNLELIIESLYHNNGLVTREDDEESKKVIGEMQNAENIQTTKDENRVLG